MTAYNAQKIVLDDMHDCLQCPDGCAVCAATTLLYQLLSITGAHVNSIEETKCCRAKSHIAHQLPLTHCTLLHQAPSDTVESRPWSVLWVSRVSSIANPVPVCHHSSNAILATI